jgi:hypothetical protein
MDDRIELEELRALLPALPVGPLPADRLSHQKEIVMREVRRSLELESLVPQVDPRPPRRRSTRRRPRRWSPLAAAALIVLSGAAIAWAVAASTARDTVSIRCEIEGVSSVIPAASGDPVADCAAQWERDTGSAEPPLAAYDNGKGGITVLPAVQAPPSGWTRLEGGEAQNVAIVQMQQWLDDYVAGLRSGCFDHVTAAGMTERALDRFGMDGWSVGPEPSSDAGPCVDTGTLDPDTRTVTLRALDGRPNPGAPFEQLAAKLRSIAELCTSIDAAARQVRAAAGDLGLFEEAHEYEVTEVPDDSLGCTTITESVGGTIFVVLRGPSS